MIFIKIILLESSTSPCKKCSPCWSVFSKNYGSCSKMNHSSNLFMSIQSICADTLILLIIFWVSIVTLVPGSIWLLYLWLKNSQDDDIRYIMDISIVG